MLLLQVSTAAVTALEQARTAQDVPDDYGVRVFGQPDPQDPTAIVLGLGFADQPAEGDQVTEQDGTPIYVAADVAEPLADSRLDVTESPEGLQLVVTSQAGTE